MHCIDGGNAVESSYMPHDLFMLWTEAWLMPWSLSRTIPNIANKNIYRSRYFKIPPFPFELKGDKIKNCPHVEAAESE